MFFKAAIYQDTASNQLNIGIFLYNVGSRGIYKYLMPQNKILLCNCLNSYKFIRKKYKKSKENFYIVFKTFKSNFFIHEKHQHAIWHFILGEYSI